MIIKLMKLKQFQYLLLCVQTGILHLLTQNRDALRQQQGHTGSFLVMNSLAANIKKCEIRISFLPSQFHPQQDLQLKETDHLASVHV